MVLANNHRLLSQINLTDDRILIHNLEILGKDAVDYLQQVPEEERDRTCISAFKVGFHCLGTTQNTQEIESVKRQITSLLSEVEKAIAHIPDTVQQELLSKLGTQDGQALAPVKTLIDQVSGVTKERVDEVKALLSQDIDPSKETSVLGNALKNIKTLIDPTRNDSVQGVLTTALKDVSAENGTLAKAVKSVVVEAVKPLADEVDRLTKEIRGKQAAQEVLQHTTAKGITYEEAVVAELQHWSKLAGAEVYYVGTDNNSGDILIKLTPKSIAATELSIVIEARDRESEPWGRKRISEQLNKAMAQRGANAAIFLSRTCNGLRQEIGEWAEGVGDRGSWVATTHDLLTLAIRFLIMQQRLTALRASQPEMDAIALSDQIARMRTTLKRIKSINEHLTALRKSANSIETEAETLKNELRDALNSIEDAVREVSSEI
jgi:DNA repair ATPase RecN